MYTDISRIDKSLRSYQQQAKEDIFSAWDKYDNVLLQMPTGTGKTRLFTSIISDIKSWSVLHSKEKKILIIAHRIELIEQISDSLNKYRISHGIIAGGKNRDLRPEVQVASIQTITHHANYEVAKDLNIDFIIIDEAHHSTANSYKKLWSMYPLAKKLGVTATPWRMNNMGFLSVYNTLLVSKPIKYFIEKGWLAPYRYYSINHLSSLKREINAIQDFDLEGDYQISALEKVVDKNSIRAHLLESYLKLAKGKKGIIYSISRKHSDHICEEFRQAGINIVRIDSKTPKNERRLYVERFKKGQIDIIVNVDIFSEGFDCPDIEFIQLARPTKSLVKYLQQVGRGLRPVEGKGKCLILDNVGSHFEFGFPDSDRNWEDSFKGGAQQVLSTNPRLERELPLKANENFVEGTEQLCLVEEVIGKENEVASNLNDEIWTESDIQLLITLYHDKQCPLEVLAVVFKKNVDDVQSKIKQLKL